MYRETNDGAPGIAHAASPLPRAYCTSVERTYWAEGQDWYRGYENRKVHHAFGHATRGGLLCAATSAVRRATLLAARHTGRDLDISNLVEGIVHVNGAVFLRIGHLDAQRQSGVFGDQQAHRAQE